MLACLSLGIASVAFAQLDPGSLERTVPRLEARPTTEGPKVLPMNNLMKGAQFSGRFVLSAVNIEGATILTSSQLSQSFEPFLASEVGQAELEKIAADITARYRSAGYPLSYAMIPEQSVVSGIVRIRVIEGYIGNVRVEGDATAVAAVRAVTARLTRERPLKARTLERALGLARDLPGVLVGDAQISRATEDPARHELVIAVGRNRFRALGYSDNRGTIDGARLRAYSAVNASSVVVPGDDFEVDLFAIPSTKFRYLFGQAKASLPLNTDGLRFDASASLGDQRQPHLSPRQIGFSRQFVGELNYPLVKGRALSLLGRLSLGAWSSEEKAGGALFQRDRLQVVRALLDFAAVGATRIDGRIGVSQGIDLGGATRAGDPLASRSFAGGKFTKFRADFQVAKSVSERMKIRFEVSAQLSNKPLLAPEEFSLGGSHIGRAFDLNEVTGDEGFGGMVELGYRLPDPSTGPKAVELFSFVDGGGAFRKRPSSAFSASQWLASAGLGLRGTISRFSWSGELGVPLAASHAKRNARVFCTLARAF